MFVLFQCFQSYIPIRGKVCTYRPKVIYLLRGCFIRSGAMHGAVCSIRLLVVCIEGKGSVAFDAHQ